MIKSFLKACLRTLMVFIIVYALCGFVEMQWDPYKMPVSERGCILFITLAVGIVVNLIAWDNDEF